MENDANTSVINLKLHARYKWGWRINCEPADYNWVQRKQVSIGNHKNVHETAIKDLLKLHEPFLSVPCNVTLFPSFSSFPMTTYIYQSPNLYIKIGSLELHVAYCCFYLE